MSNIDQTLATLGDQTVLCIGDLMLDDFVYGDVLRISPEAPAPVLAVKRSEVVVGGAGNVARNVAALGARCIFVGVVGEDEAGRRLTTTLAAEGRIEPYLVVDRARLTTRKIRFVSDHFSTHLLRADWELIEPVSTETEKTLIKHVLASLPRVGAVILSDYAKGVLTPGLIRAVIDGAHKLHKPVIVDPKGADFSVYRGATMVTPNQHELERATRLPAKSDLEVAAAAADLAVRVGGAAILVTRSEEGMSLVPNGGHAVHVPAYPVKVRDVSGAGDTVVAVVATMLAAGADFEAATRAANAAAGVVVGKRGTATVSIAELRSRLLPAALRAPEEKIVFDWSQLDEHLDDWRRQGLRIGFTNGCFDILHRGHIKVLAGARAACDRLVVGINGDASVARLKGPGRPIQDEASRAELLAALEAVDLVVIFPQDTPLELIRQVRPKVLVKGGDYRRESVVGHEVVEAEGGEVIIIDLIPGISTTEIARRASPADLPPAAAKRRR